MKNIVMILASGKSTRCQSDKLFKIIDHRTILWYTIQIFAKCKKIDEILLIVSEKNYKQAQELQKNINNIKFYIIIGGKDRFNSFQNGIKFLLKEKKSNCRILVHNGANPQISSEDLLTGLGLAETHKNVIFGFFSIDAIKEVILEEEQYKIKKTLNRKEIFICQTPQISDLYTFKKAIKIFYEANKLNSPDDESELLTLVKEDIYIYECSRDNTKITYPEDFVKFESNLLAKKKINMRIGIGEDSHSFNSRHKPQKFIILGGITFPDIYKNFQANSDGDVIFHALCNALLSSIGEKPFGSIADKMCQSGIENSAEYVSAILNIVYERHPYFQISNCCVSLECEIPRIEPYHIEIQTSIAEQLQISIKQVGLTYTTGEKLSAVGQGKGVRCLVQILVSY